MCTVYEETRGVLKVTSRPESPPPCPSLRLTLRPPLRSSSRTSSETPWCTPLMLVARQSLALMLSMRSGAKVGRSVSACPSNRPVLRLSRPAFDSRQMALVARAVHETATKPLRALRREDPSVRSQRQREPPPFGQQTVAARDSCERARGPDAESSQVS